MSKFLVSFKIKKDSDYDRRYDSFIEQLKQTNLWWDETTSFVAVKTEETIDTFCSRIYVKSGFDSSKDIYLVLDAEKQDGRVRGPITDSYLFTLLPFVKKQ